MSVGRAWVRSLLWLALSSALASCGSSSSKVDEEAARNTFACEDAGERLVIRFERGEVRLLLPSGEAVNLYEVPSASGVRYTNGAFDLYGKGTDLKLARNGNAPRPLVGCAPLKPAS